MPKQSLTSDTTATKPPECKREKKPTKCQKRNPAKKDLESNKPPKQTTATGAAPNTPKAALNTKRMESKTQLLLLRDTFILHSMPPFPR